MFQLIWITFFCLTMGWALAAAPPEPIWKRTSLDNLRRDLLATYDTNSLPSFGHTNNVTVGLTVMQLQLDDDAGVLTSSVWMRMVWEDPKMSWNSSAYDNISTIRMGANELWKPDLEVYNSACPNQVNYYGATNLLAQNNGSILWVPPAQLKTNCAVDLRRWPLDTQHCEIKMGSWTYDGSEVDLLLNGLDLSNVPSDNGWQVVDSDEERNEIVYACCPEPYVDITFQLTLRRQSAIYGPVVAAPVIAVVVMSLVVFWMPAAVGPKLLVNGMNMVVIVGHLLYFALRWPTIGGSNTPYVVCFYSKALYLSVISVIVAMAVGKISQLRQTNCLPRIVRSALDGWLGSVLLLHSVDLNTAEIDELARRLDGDAGAAADGQKNGSGRVAKLRQNHRYWVLLAIAISRVLSVVYAVLFALMACAYFVCL